MGASDLNRVALTMGKVLKELDRLEPAIKSVEDMDSHKEDLFVMAYVCRIGILDRIEENSYMLNGTFHFRIPTGMFTSMKVTMDSALNLTIGRLKRIVSKDSEIQKGVHSILNRQEAFYELDRIMPETTKQRI